MDQKIFNTLQETIKIDTMNALVKHPQGYKERGYKYQYDLWFIKKGIMSFTYESSDYILTEGDMFLMYPNVMYESKVISDQVELIFSHFDCLLGNSPTALMNFKLSGFYPRKAYINTTTNQIVEAFLDSYDLQSSNGFLATYITKQYFGILMAAFFDYRMKQEAVTSLSESFNSKSKNKVHRLMPAIEFIHGNYTSPISVESLARKTAISEKYFITYFRDTIGLTPLKYQTRLRMQEAVKLLYQQNYAIKEISYRLGYSDQYNFSTAFRKHYGIAPSKYLTDGEKVLGVK